MPYHKEAPSEYLHICCQKTQICHQSPPQTPPSCTQRTLAAVTHFRHHSGLKWLQKFKQKILAGCPSEPGLNGLPWGASHRFQGSPSGRKIQRESSRQKPLRAAYLPHFPRNSCHSGTLHTVGGEAYGGTWQVQGQQDEPLNPFSRVAPDTFSMGNII